MMDKNNPTTPILSARYQLQQKVAAGGMAVIYKAWDLHLERFVAVKVLRQNFSVDSSFRESFRQEARAAANLSHPNIVTVHDFGFDQDRLFIVMELVPGIDLKTMIKQRGKFAMQDAISLITQACQALGYAHRAGLVHCDVKPHNMLITPDMRLKVTDFGIARAVAAIPPDEKMDVVWGSPQYFSPEQASGSAPSPASDVYSLGVILYELLTGKLPFEADDSADLARMHRVSQPPSPRQLNPDIPPSLEQIILKVLSKEPSSRYRSADQFGRILANFRFDAQPSTAQPAVSPRYANQPQAVRTAVVVPPFISSPSPEFPATQSQETHGSGLGVNGRTTVKPTHAPEFDWLTIGLSLLALLTVGGLIPFWLYIWLSFNPPR